MSSSQSSDLTRAARYAVPFFLLLIPAWRNKVDTVVPEPYLDEVFHVSQAQAYWAHKWTQWDPKITTPPGLYLWSYALCAFLFYLRGSPTEVDAGTLRATNVAATSVVLPWRLQTLLDSLRRESNRRPLGAWLSHTVLNICLFPPLLFFSGLYYTDALALLVVIEAYNWDIKRVSVRNESSVAGTLVFLLFGLAALVFRQTNIFWVSVFLGGLRAVRTVRHSSRDCESSDLKEIASRSSKREIYDPPVKEASAADYLKTTISYAIAGINNFPSIFLSLVPYLVILAAFGGFVLWNNGVVLGHKEFHTAGLHLAQMLYIWPYFLFFSWPLLVVPVLNLLLPSTYLPKVFNYGFPKRRKGLPKILTAAIVIPIMLAIVHFNTVVHPFTLADNRHYVFYAFRLLLRYHPAVKYAATLVYFLGAWAVISALGSSTVAPPRQRAQVPSSQAAPATALAPPTKEQPKGPEEQPKETKKKQKTNSNGNKTQTPPKPEADPIPPEALARLKEHIINRQREQQGPRVSFVLVWLLSTALCLVTAPLVEPRYFIIPWVIWRLHLPQPTLAMYRDRRLSEGREITHAKLMQNLPLFLETFWFLYVNAVTGYIFLYKGFEWKQEPGKIQRFLW